MSSLVHAFISVAIGLLVTGCSERPSSKANTDGEITRRIVGKWKVNEAVSQGLSANGFVSFTGHGTLASKGELTRGRCHMSIEYSGTWVVENGLLIETVTNGNSNLVHIGLVTRDKILSIDDRRLSYQTEKGRIITRERIR
jgi:hypothetical protein